MTMFEQGPREDTDLEAGDAVAVQPGSNPGTPARAAAAPATTAAAGGNGSGGAATATAAAAASAGAVGSDTRSSWSARELLSRAEGLAQVRVTPAWSLTAALGAMESSSSAVKSAAPSIVQQVATAQSIGLVLCGCAGSGQPPLATAPGQQQGGGGVAGAGGAGAGTGSNDLPLAGTRSVHAKWPSLGSRHGPGSLMTRSWHGKSRHHARGSHRAREAAAATNARFGGSRPGSHSRQSGMASAVKGVINSALWDIIGDVAAGLVRSEPAPAVLAVRSSMSVTSATV